MDDLTQYGPAMLALNERQRKFVLAMAADPFGNAKKWAKVAGYSDKADGAKVRGHYLIHHPKIEAASFEVAAGLMGSVGPLLAARGMLRVAANPKHKKHMQAVEMLANRVGLHEVKEVRLKRTDETGEALLERVKRLARELGVDPESLIGANAEVPRLIGPIVDAVPAEK